jgi:hypothetical protein
MEKLLETANGRTATRERVGELWVQEMPDGGMGSLYICKLTKDASDRRFGRRISELLLNDADGVTIIASLNVDRDGDLYELDVWKTNFAPLIRLDPNPVAP